MTGRFAPEPRVFPPRSRTRAWWSMVARPARAHPDTRAGASSRRSASSRSSRTARRSISSRLIVRPIAADLGWSHAQIDGAYSWGLAVSAVAGVPIGAACDRYGARAIMAAGAAGAGRLAGVADGRHEPARVRARVGTGDRARHRVDLLSGELHRDRALVPVRTPARVLAPDLHRRIFVDDLLSGSRGFSSRTTAGATRCGAWPPSTCWWRSRWRLRSCAARRARGWAKAATRNDRCRSARRSARCRSGR